MEIKAPKTEPLFTIMGIILFLWAFWEWTAYLDYPYPLENAPPSWPLQALTAATICLWAFLLLTAPPKPITTIPAFLAAFINFYAPITFMLKYGSIGLYTWSCAAVGGTHILFLVPIILFWAAVDLWLAKRRDFTLSDTGFMLLALSIVWYHISWII